MLRRHHPGAWLVLATLAVLAVYTIPLRHHYLSPLASQAPPVLVQAYISLVPVLAGAVYVFLSEGAWGGAYGRWHLPRPRAKGALVLALGYGGVLALDYACFRLLFPAMRAPAPVLEDFTKNYGMCLGAGFIAALINGLEARGRKEAGKAKEAGAALAEARSRLVDSQLEPHSMFNMLNGVDHLIDHNPEQAHEMLNAASRYLRKIIYITKNDRILLDEEREIVADFLQVEALRMGERIHITWDWSRDFYLGGIQIPPLLVQPLVENAIKHGIWPSRDGGDLVLRARQEGEHLVLSVANTGEPLVRDTREGATGLENLRLRMGLAYGPSATLSLRSDGAWTVATLTLPLEPSCAS